MARINSINNETSELTIDPGASGDSYINFSINGTGTWQFGCDDNDSDAFVLSQGSTLGTNNSMHITAVGEVQCPLNPAAMADTATTADATGDGTVVTPTWNTEIFDQGGNASGATFEAPITGRYLIGAYVYSLGDGITNGSSSFTSWTLSLVTSNRTYIQFINPSALFNSSAQVWNINTLADMDASDTFQTTWSVSGDTKTIDLRNLSKLYALLAC